MKKVKRNFYKVGNGLFAMEHTNGLTSVYDCGSTSQACIDKAIDRAMINYRDPIDNLFISHFDKDHVNGLLKLLNNYSVTRVILPLIPNITRVVNSSSVRTGFQSDFIIDPETFIQEVSPKTNVVFVEASNLNDENNEMQNNNPRINLEAIEIGTKLQGKFQECVLNGWMYVIYNRRTLTDAEIAIFMGKLGLTINATTDDIIAVLKRKGVNLKDSLKSVFTPQEISDINDYSMVVWSGMEGCMGLGCLYMGDYNAMKYWRELNSVYKRLKVYTEIIQIPHHGSRRNFNLEICSHNSIHIISAHKGPYSRQRVDPNFVINNIHQNGFSYKDTRLGDITL